MTALALLLGAGGGCDGILGGGGGPLGPEDVPKGTDPITTFDGEWLSELFALAFEITDRLGISTLPSSDATKVGDVVLVITSVDGNKFDGREIFVDGSVQDVIGRLIDPNTLVIAGAGITWSMTRISTPEPFPEVMAGDDQTITIDPGEVDLDGTIAENARTDDFLATFWTLESGPAAVDITDPEALDTTVAFTQVGVYVLELTLSDGAQTSADTVTITVNEPAPVDAGKDRNVVVGLVVTLDGSSSSERDEDELSFTWVQTEGADVELENADTAQATFTVPDAAESLGFTLTVEDTLQTTDTASITLTTVAEPRVRLSTTLGDVVLDILLDDAPINGLNFLQYVEDGFYDGTIFHRVVPDFVVQGGGRLPGDVPQANPRDPIVNEFSADRSNIRATVAMAKIGGDPDSATSEFFFNLADNSEILDDQNGGFTVFARVVVGMEVVDAMAGVEIDGEVPLVDIVLTSATME